MKQSQSYLDAAALFAAEGWHVHVDDTDGGETYMLTATPTAGDKRIAQYALTPELAIWQAWAEYDKNRENYAV